MLHKTTNVTRIKKRNRGSIIKKSLFFLILSLFIIYNYTNWPTAKGSTYTPASPSGPESGFVNLEYDFSVFTSELDAFWMFDWGDGNYSDWSSLIESGESVTQSHTWILPGIYQIRVKYNGSYVEEWSPYVGFNVTEPEENDYPNTPTIPLGKIVGMVNSSYSYTTNATDPKEDEVQYRFDWGDETISDWTTLCPSGHHSTMSHIWTQSGSYLIRSQARDSDRLNSSWSDPLNITIEPDSDGDGLSDNTENEIGSDPTNTSDVYGIFIYNKTNFIVSASNGEMILFYNITLEDFSILVPKGDGTYLIDDNCDNTWDYIYNPLFDSIVIYEETSEEESSFQIPLVWMIVGLVICVIIITVYFLIKKGYIYIYEEYIIEE